MKKISEHLYLINNHEYNFFIIVKNGKGMLVEGGTSAGADFFARTWENVADKPDISYIVLLHAHFDHICGTPILKRLFPDAQLIASEAAADIMSQPKIIKKFYATDFEDAELSLRLGEIDRLPTIEPVTTIIPEIKVHDGYILNLEDLEVEFIMAPGHSQCSMAVYLKEDQALLVSDAAGYSSEDSMIPYYFYDFDLYIKSLRRFIEYKPQFLGLAHHNCPQGDTVMPYLEKNIRVAYEMFERISESLRAGKEVEQISEEIFNIYIAQFYEKYPLSLCKELTMPLIKNTRKSESFNEC